LSSQREKQLVRGGTSDPEAYRLYLQGRYYWEKRTQDSLQKAKDYFTQAINKDPNYALAYVGLADYYIVVGEYTPIPSSVTIPGEKTAAQKALAIDDSLAEAHLALASVHWDSWEWEAAEREFKRTLELNPSLSNAHHWYGLFLSWHRRPEEALIEMKRAVELDPLNLRYNTNLGQVYFNAGQNDLAPAQLQKTVEIDPNFADLYEMRSVVRKATGDYRGWLQDMKKNAELNADEEEAAVADAVGRVYSESGYRAALLRRIELQKEMSKRRYVDPTSIALDYAALGDKDQTFLWLEKAYSERARGLEAIEVVFENPVRSDPRYLNLTKRMGLQK